MKTEKDKKMQLIHQSPAAIFGIFKNRLVVFLNITITLFYLTAKFPIKNVTQRNIPFNMHEFCINSGDI